MAEKFIINGGLKLSGEVTPQGSKNATGPCLAACLLTDKECTIDNLPLIEDVLTMLEVFKSIGVEVTWLSQRKVKIKAAKIDISGMDLEKVSKTRISVLLFGSLLARAKKFTITPPGGDRIGLRPITVHLSALEKLGADIERSGEVYTISTKNVKGSEIVLQEASVTATETIMLAAALAKGNTVIKGAAAEPHVQELARMLHGMGLKIKGAGTHTIEIEGSHHLEGVSHVMSSDPIESATFLVMGAVVPGSSITIKNAGLDDYFMFLEKIRNMGVKFKKKGNDILVTYSPTIKPVNLQAMPYPGFPTDFLPVCVPLLLKAKGKSLIHDPMYENRFNYVEQLRKMGGDIEIVDPHRAFVFGPANLMGLTIESWDIRAGACLVIAAMMAKGMSTIKNVYQIDRGYEKIEERLQKLGADIQRVNS
jgi:UDP-N-acetylglucosamine 1-carboxyvinyltransferase